MMNTLLNACVRELGVMADGFPWEDRRAYADWLAQTYYYVRHTTRLLAAAASRFALDERGNAVHHRFAAHMGEEKKHELLAIHDLKQLNASIERFPEHASTRMFYEPQYYKIEHLGPMVPFGYILPLEAIGPACGKRVIERITGVHGPKCVSFVRLHSDEDPDHLQKAIHAIEDVSAVERAHIEDNMRQTTFAYGVILSDIKRNRNLEPPVLE
jgi:hypothetical protein